MEDEKTKIVTGRQASVKKALAREFRRAPTPTERMLWARLRDGGLRGVHFRRQQIIAGFIADFYCHSAQLVVEIDGAVHENQAEYDAERDRVLAAHDLRVLRVTAEEVQTNIRSVLARIVSAMEERE